ncbi:protein prenylyltransferase [Chloropicon primus]|nr:protein prenylyltransferase [Chloropicon primus]
MHGRKREAKEVKHSSARVEARRRKAKLYAELSRECFARRNQKRYDEETLALCQKLLEMNCELYTLWNHRKEYLEPILLGSSSDAKGAAEKELKLIEACLQRNPKSYCCWQHRKWVVDLANRLPNAEEAALDRELGLCDLLLSVDERNFHCWSYRRFVCSLHKAREPEVELDFTTDKISQNFSNYSSWHYRSALLPEINKVTSFEDLVRGGGGENTTTTTSSSSVGVKRVLPPHVLDEEFGLVKQAFFTEPEDQSSWLYHAWLINHLVENEKKFGSYGDERVGERLEQEVETCNEILEIEPESKWPLLTLARLLEAQAARAGGEGSESSAAGLHNKMRQLYRKLEGIDPMRRGYYLDAIAAVGNEEGG